MLTAIRELSTVHGVTSANNGGGGITVQFNSNQNTVGRCTANGNTGFDLNDRHSNGCASDIWFANQFTTRSNTCIQ